MHTLASERKRDRDISILRPSRTKVHTYKYGRAVCIVKRCGIARVSSGMGTRGRKGGSAFDKRVGRVSAHSLGRANVRCPRAKEAE